MENVVRRSKFFRQHLNLEMPLRAFVYSFDCSLFINRDATKCFYNNQVFNISEEIDSPDIASSCTAGCRCIEADENEPKSVKASFRCTHIDCPEFFGEPEEENKTETCVNQYERNSCCSTNQVCGE